MIRTASKRFIPYTLLALFIGFWPGYSADKNPPKPDSPPGDVVILNENGVIQFPFEIFNGDIRFAAAINGRDVHLLLDDGYMWDQLLFWGGPEVDSLGLEYDGEIGVGGGGGEGEQLMSKTASGISVVFPGVEFIDQEAIITPASSGNSTMWYGSVGQISAAFFKHFVVDINFDDMMITLIEPNKFEYTKNGVAVPWEPLGFGPRSIPATLKAVDGRRVSLKLLMDLGYNDQLRIYTTGPNQFPLPKKVLPVSLGFNIQGIETVGYDGRMPQVDIGGYKLDGVLVGYATDERSDSTIPEVMIGLGLLSRFNLVFDYFHNRIFFEPNKTFNNPFKYNTSGFRMRKQGDHFVITRVYDNSPASEAELQKGDRVLEIDSKPIIEYEQDQLRDMFRRENVDMTLLIERDGNQSSISLTLRRII